MKKTFLAVAFLAASLVSAPASAAVIGINGVETEVEVTADLAGLGLTPAPAGTATVESADPLIVAFPITGGFLDTHSDNALIEHDGSGVTLSAGMTSATIGNFLIDTGAGTVSGDIFGVASGVTFFNLGMVEALGIELFISTDLAGALSEVFGAPPLAGALFGYARPNVSLVPVPAALPLLLGGLAVLGFVGRRRSA